MRGYFFVGFWLYFAGTPCMKPAQFEFTFVTTLVQTAGVVSITSAVASLATAASTVSDEETLRSFWQEDKTDNVPADAINSRVLNFFTIRAFKVKDRLTLPE
jgi:hypothetical protein